MKKIILAAAAAASIITGTFVIFAQGAKSAHKHGCEAVFSRMAERLGLSDEQRAAIRQVLTESRSRIKPLAETIRQNHTAVKDLGTDGVFDEQRVMEAADRQAAALRQMIIEKERTKAGIFAVLTPQQRAEALQLREQMKGRFIERIRGHFGDCADLSGTGE